MSREKSAELIAHEDLLRHSAIAVGWTYVGIMNSLDYETDVMLYDKRLKKNIIWNPLKNNADAFQLQVELELEIYYSDDEGMAVYAGYNCPSDAKTVFAIEYFDDITHLGCKYSATRKAIVRASYEIGKCIAEGKK